MEMLEFWRFKPVNTELVIEITGVFDYSLVILSIFIASLAAYSALVVLERIWATSNKNTLNIWLWLGAFVMGVGVWAMHFTGMLAFMLPVPMKISPLITFISAIPPVLGTYVALKILSKRLFSFWWIQIGSLSLAVGIGTMHFVGMEAMVMDAYMHYNFFLFAGSIVIAHVLATVALYTRVIVKTTEDSRAYWRIFSAFIMGSAVAGMHYTAMAAVRYYAVPDFFLDHDMMSLDSLVLSLIIFALVALFVGVTIIATLVDRRLQSAEESAQKRKVREHAVVETLADALVVIDELGKIERCNSSGVSMFQQNMNAIVGGSIELLMPGITWQDLVSDAEKSKTLIIGETLELVGIKGNGESFPAEVRFSKMTIDSKLMFNAIIRDVSVRKRIEEQLRQAQKLESIGQLAAGIAHEINTPIQYISDNTSFLKKSFPNIITAMKASQALLNSENFDASSENIKAVQTALKNAKIDFMAEEIPNAIDQSLDGLQRVATIVSAMKSFSHSSNGKKKNTNIKEAIETTATVARNEWKYIADMNFNFDSNLPEVPCLRDEFNQVILNIIVNAAHAITDTLGSSGRKKGLISISAKAHDKHVVITITDDGKGMPLDVQKKIFDPFFTTKEIGKGTGQGLSIAHAVIVEKHQGEITVESQVGKGSSFIIKLPLQSKIDLKKENINE